MTKGLRPDGITWEAVESCFSARDPIFTNAWISQLLLAMGSPLAPGRTREELATALSNAAANYAFDYYNQIQPGPQELEAQADEISRACRLVLNSLGIIGLRKVTGENLFPVLGPGGLYAAAADGGAVDGRASVLAAVQSVADLKGWAEALRETAKRQGIIHPKAKPGRPPNRAYERLLADLTRIYFEGWDRLPGISTSHRRPSASEGEISETRSALEARVEASGKPIPQGFLRFLCEVSDALLGRGVPAPESAEAIAKAWSRLPAEDRLKFD
jgi:hypothetical protein